MSLDAWTSTTSSLEFLADRHRKKRDAEAGLEIEGRSALSWDSNKKEAPQLG